MLDAESGETGAESGKEGVALKGLEATEYSSFGR